MSKCNLSLDSSSHEEDEDACDQQLNLSHLKVDQVHKPNFWHQSSPPTLLTLGVPGVENHEPMFGSNYSSSTQSDSQQPKQRKTMTRGGKRKCGEDIEHLVSEFDANGSGMTSRRNEDDLQQCSKASSVEMHKMSERSGRASVLDQAIQHIQALQHQIQVMSMDGIPAWHSASPLLAGRNQIMQSTLQFNPYVPIIPRIAIGSFFWFWNIY
ncbi:hypothetical protein K7X08_001200 [Anisodus acutangulus]|uniref:BHLH domain-containing protein n=1 Tax=Anisodus acutangulus TaxID=402998 RepID=A0A9Q1RKD8_9SOLA|nr:hypothetical protein K7X08_001200 [Anisodus acutangulus]